MTTETMSMQSRVGDFLSIVLVVLPVLWAIDAPGLLGYPLLNVQFAMLLLGTGLSLTFLLLDIRGQRRIQAPIPDVVLAIVSLALCAYGFIVLPEITDSIYVERTRALVLSTGLLLVALEGIRRALGTAMLVLVLAFLLYGMLGHHAPGLFQTIQTPLDTFLIYNVAGGESLTGRALIIIGTVVLVFIVFGQFLTSAGGGIFLTDCAALVAGRGAGAPAKIAILSSGVLGSISGSVTANVTSTGAVTIPLMRRTGIHPYTAAGIEAFASTGGQLMPPIMGAAAFLMVEFLGVTYSNIIIAAMLPSILFYAALMFQTNHLPVMAVSGDSDGGLEPADPRSLLAASPIFLLPFSGIVIALLMFRVSPLWAGVVGIVLAIASSMLFQYRGQRLDLEETWSTLKRAGNTVVSIINMGAAAGLVIGILNLTGLGVSVGIAISTITHDNVVLILLIAGLAAVVLGMGLPTTAIYILVATLLAPPLVDQGVSPMAAHLFVFYTGMLCMITPPVAFASYAAASVAGTPFNQTALAGLRFGWPIFLVPFLFVLSPGLLMEGSAMHIAWTFLLSLSGLWFVTTAFSRTLPRTLTFPALLPGLALLYPFSWDGHTWVHGLGVAGALLWTWHRRSHPAVAASRD